MILEVDRKTYHTNKIVKLEQTWIFIDNYGHLIMLFLILWKFMLQAEEDRIKKATLMAEYDKERVCMRIFLTNLYAR